jgi:hypothetical protein
MCSQHSTVAGSADNEAASSVSRNTEPETARVAVTRSGPAAVLAIAPVVKTFSRFRSAPDAAERGGATPWFCAWGASRGARSHVRRPFANRRGSHCQPKRRT